MRHSLLHTALVALLLLAATPSAFAQIYGGESAFKLAPAITGDRSRVFIGTQRGTILIATSTATDVTITDSLTNTGAGAKLPSELQAIWYLSMPNRVTSPDLIVALVTYDDNGTSRYGVLRSTDFGITWTLIKDPALANPMFIPTNNFWASTTLRDMKWLGDGVHGWIYGPKGIAATTDAGLTWQLRYTQGKDSAFHVQALAFRDPMNGVASIGWVPIQRLYVTTDGGVTWAPRRAPEGTRRVNQIEWIGNQYRALIFDRAAVFGSGSPFIHIYRSTDLGESWNSRPIGNIQVEQTYHTEWLWVDDQKAVMIMKSGEIAATTNGGTTWTSVQNADSVNYPMEINTARGFGYASIILDGTKIVHASTTSSNGALYRLVQWNLVTSGVHDDDVRIVRAAVVPTPARDLVRLELEHPLSPSARASIVDHTGRTARTIAVEHGSTRLDVDVADLSSGHYRLIVEDADRRVVAPIIVAH